MTLDRQGQHLLMKNRISDYGKQLGSKVGLQNHFGAVISFRVFSGPMEQRNHFGHLGKEQCGAVNQILLLEISKTMFSFGKY